MRDASSAACADGGDKIAKNSPRTIGIHADFFVTAPPEIRSSVQYSGDFAIVRARRHLSNC
jgi:hypothetical protein